MEFLPLLLLPVLLVWGIAAGIINGIYWIADVISSRRERKRQRIEADLDRQQEQLRASILNLASQLGADALEARKALIRESFLASRDDYLSR